MMQVYSSVIFDLDGTLLDTLDDLADATNRALGRLGFPTHPVNAFKYLVGDGVVMLVTRALPEDRRDPATIEKCITIYKEEYDRNKYHKTRPYPGIPEMLDAITDLRLKIAVLSNKPHDFTVQCVDRFLGRWKWDVVLGQTDAIPRKPSPAGAIEIARRLGTPVSDFAYVGDTKTDMLTATTAGMLPVGVLWGFREREELEQSGARIIITSPNELVELFQKIRGNKAPGR
jgi:phosphoglycolate phosphatase